ncbi:hypothetical protein CW745_16305 [Psychromonas sp. psych-6C06]|uniref:hypothetical protein n=1 Tax=Psychromonas sp. psych-6C06 TaxID=2058089 RepID=UPI000C328351|nr:hypothetical protein [Psychromonas sp. psych-6C06]PKF60190.1 hypothetical protein CW745_16305 [Psychromonas sp. psych-6C06]
MKKVILVLAIIIVTVVLMVVSSPKETVIKVEVTPTLDETIEVSVPTQTTVSKVKSQEEYIDLSGLKFEDEEVFMSDSATASPEVAESEYQQQKPSTNILNKDGSKISAEEEVKNITLKKNDVVAYEALDAINAICGTSIESDQLINPNDKISFDFKDISCETVVNLFFKSDKTKT